MAGMPKSAQVAIRSSGSEAPSRKLKAERALSSMYPDIRLLFSYTQIMQQRRRAVKLVIVSVKPKHSIRVYPCPSVAKNQPSKADRTSKKTSDLATDGHGYTRMRSVGILALDREKIGTKLYGYVLAKRYTSAASALCGLRDSCNWMNPGSHRLMTASTAASSAVFITTSRLTSLNAPRRTPPRTSSTRLL